MSRGERPLLKGKNPEELKTFVTEQLALRTPFYEKAHHVIDINVLDSFDKVNYIVDVIRTKCLPKPQAQAQAGPAHS